MSVATLEQQSPELGGDAPIAALEPRPLGFWRSLGWLVLACVVGGLVSSTLVIVLWQAQGRPDIRGFLDSAVFDYTYAIGALGVVPVLAWAIRRADWRVW